MAKCVNHSRRAADVTLLGVSLCTPCARVALIAALTNPPEAETREAADRDGAVRTAQEQGELAPALGQDGGGDA